MLILLILVIAPKIVAQICDNSLYNVPLINRSYNGIQYNEGEFFVDPVTGIEKGCVCFKENCIQKCCKIGQIFRVESDRCEDLEMDFDPPVPGTNKKLGSVYNLLNCTGEELQIRADHGFHLISDGRLQVDFEDSIPPTVFYGPYKYCLDNFVLEDNTTIVDGFICYSEPKEPNHLHISATCMLISCFFMLLTVAVYLLLKDLRKSVHGLVLIAYLLCFSVFFLFMTAMQISLLNRSINSFSCTILTFFIFFAAHSGFFWLNVMCYDIWQKFRKINAVNSASEERTKRQWYCVYAFGVPTVLTILVAILEFSGLEYNKLLPNLRRNGCFIEGTSKMLYLYTPMLLICCGNVIFFALVAIKIAQIKKQTQKLNKKDTQRYAVYIKLFLLTGFSWVLEAVSDLYPEYETVWWFTDAYNALFGVIIFIIFVCKKKIYEKLMKMFKPQKQQ